MAKRTRQFFVVFKLYLFYNDYETTDINPARWHRCSRYHYASQDSLVKSCHLNVHIQLQTIIKVHAMLLHHSKLLVLLLIYNDAMCHNHIAMCKDKSLISKLRVGQDKYGKH